MRFPFRIFLPLLLILYAIGSPQGAIEQEQHEGSHPASRLHFERHKRSANASDYANLSVDQLKEKLTELQQKADANKKEFDDADRIANETEKLFTAANLNFTEKEKEWKRLQGIADKAAELDKNVTDWTNKVNGLNRTVASWQEKFTKEEKLVNEAQGNVTEMENIETVLTKAENEQTRIGEEIKKEERNMTTLEGIKNAKAESVRKLREKFNPVDRLYKENDCGDARKATVNPCKGILVTWTPANTALVPEENKLLEDEKKYNESRDAVSRMKTEKKDVIDVRVELLIPKRDHKDYYLGKAKDKLTEVGKSAKSVNASLLQNEALFLAAQEDLRKAIEAKNKADSSGTSIDATAAQSAADKAFLAQDLAEKEQSRLSALLKTQKETRDSKKETWDNANKEIAALQKQYDSKTAPSTGGSNTLLYLGIFGGIAIVLAIIGTSTFLVVKKKKKKRKPKSASRRSQQKKRRREGTTNSAKSTQSVSANSAAKEPDACEAKAEEQVRPVERNAQITVTSKLELPDAIRSNKRQMKLIDKHHKEGKMILVQINNDVIVETEDYWGRMWISANGRSSRPLPTVDQLIYDTEIGEKFEFHDKLKNGHVNGINGFTLRVAYFMPPSWIDEREEETSSERSVSMRTLIRQGIKERAKQVASRLRGGSDETKEMIDIISIMNIIAPYDSPYEHLNMLVEQAETDQKSEIRRVMNNLGFKGPSIWKRISSGAWWLLGLILLTKEGREKIRKAITPESSIESTQSSESVEEPKAVARIQRKKHKKRGHRKNGYRKIQNVQSDRQKISPGGEKSEQSIRNGAGSDAEPELEKTQVSSKTVRGPASLTRKPEPLNEPPSTDQAESTQKDCTITGVVKEEEPKAVARIPSEKEKKSVRESQKKSLQNNIQQLQSARKKISVGSKKQEKIIDSFKRSTKNSDDKKKIKFEQGRFAGEKKNRGKYRRRRDDEKAKEAESCSESLSAPIQPRYLNKKQLKRVERASVKMRKVFKEFTEMNEQERITKIEELLCKYTKERVSKRALGKDFGLICAILFLAKIMFRGGKRCIISDGPATFVGDIHGQLPDLLNILEKSASINPRPGKEVKHVFLGDYVDRGANSLQCFLVLLLLKLRHPDKIILLRGNHESPKINKINGFAEEITLIFSNEDEADMIQDLVNEVFYHMPPCAKIGKTFCAHGGLFTDLEKVGKLEDLDKLIPNRVEDPTTDPLLADLTWSDPCSGLAAHRKNKPRNGAGSEYGEDDVDKFLEKYRLDRIVRGHQVPMIGFELFNGTKVITIFGSSHYCRFKNFGSILHVDEAGLCTLVMIVNVKDLRDPNDPVKRNEYAQKKFKELIYKTVHAQVKPGKKDDLIELDNPDEITVASLRAGDGSVNTAKSTTAIVDVVGSKAVFDDNVFNIDGSPATFEDILAGKATYSA